MIMVALIFVGLIIVLVAMTTWLQKAVSRYFQLKELRALTGEYVVQDLSTRFNTPEQQTMDPSAPPAHMVCSFAPVTEQEVQVSLSRDLQAVYGYAY